MTEQEWENLRRDLVLYLKRRGEFLRRHAEDIVQHTLLMLHMKQMAGAEELRYPLAWCKLVAWNHAKNLYKQRAREIPTSAMYDDVEKFEEDYWERLADASLDPERIATAREELQDAIPFATAYLGTGEKTNRMALSRFRQNKREKEAS